jgi:integrase
MFRKDAVVSTTAGNPQHVRRSRAMRLVEPSGHVYVREGTRGKVWYAKYRLPDGRQVKKRIGPAWTGRGRPEASTFTKRTAEEWLGAVLAEARAGTLPGLVQTGVTFEAACVEYLHWLAEVRQRKASTLRDYRGIIRTHLEPFFGGVAVEDVTQDLVEAWAAQLGAGRPITNRTKIKVMTVLYGIMERARRTYRLPRNPVRDLEKPVQRRASDIEVFSPEEVLALVRAADSEQDAAIYLTAAFTGLRRGELVALCWRDVDFARSHLRVRASYTDGVLSTPKSGKMRSVPMAPDVAAALARLSQRPLWTSDDDQVFAGATGGHLDASALYRRYKAALKRAGLRDLRFHDLRHTFGTQVIATASILKVKEWMGHADVDTTVRYLHFAPSTSDAELVAAAFAGQTPGTRGAGALAT